MIIDIGSAASSCETLTLADGRSLAYAEYGDRDGEPFVFMHGVPSSRLAGQLIHESAARQGIRLLTPDRPGYGLSDDLPDRTILDWPDDVAQLCDGLGIGHFGVMGVSGAVPYVLACAVRMPERLSHVAILSGLGPLGNPGDLKGMNRESMTLYSLAVRSPRVGRVWMKMLAQASKRSPLMVYRQQMRYLAEVDRAIFDSDEMRDLRLNDFAEAFRQGSSGPAQEAVLHVTDWGFELADIGVGVFMWQGGEDRHHPVAMAHSLSNALPNVQTVIVPEAGAFGFVPRMDEVFDALLRVPAHVTDLASRPAS